jgi:hypothetical protein
VGGEKAACGTVASAAALRRGQVGHDPELRPFHCLNHQLRDAIAGAQPYRLPGVEVDQENFDLPRYPESTVPGVLTIDSPHRAARPDRG